VRFDAKTWFHHLTLDMVQPLIWKEAILQLRMVGERNFQITAILLCGIIQLTSSKLIAVE